MINNPCSTSRQGLALATNLTLIQHNSLGSWDVFLSLFSSLTEGPPDMVLLEEPPTFKGFLPCFSGFNSFAPPGRMPRVASYVYQDFLHRFAVLPSCYTETDDVMTLDVCTPQACFGTNFALCKIGNTCARPLPPCPDSASPESSLLDLDHPYLVVGDFNIHNVSTDPLRLLSSREQRESATYFSRASDLVFTLLTTPWVYTQFPFSGAH